MARIRLNNEYRNKLANRMRVHLEQEDTQEKRDYNDNLVVEENVPIEKHFDFRLNGSIDSDCLLYTSPSPRDRG